MEPIQDFSWMQQLVTGKIVERFDYDAFEAVALEIPEMERRHSPYHFRMLFFPGTAVPQTQTSKPVLSLNLEFSILGSFCFTEHAGADHINLGHTDEQLTYEEFKGWALQEAKQHLH